MDEGQNRPHIAQIRERALGCHAVGSFFFSSDRIESFCDRTCIVPTCETKRPKNDTDVWNIKML